MFFQLLTVFLAKFWSFLLRWSAQKILTFVQSSEPKAHWLMEFHSWWSQWKARIWTFFSQERLKKCSLGNKFLNKSNEAWNINLLNILIELTGLMSEKIFFYRNSGKLYYIVSAYVRGKRIYVGFGKLGFIWLIAWECTYCKLLFLN